MNKHYRVANWGTGNVGLRALKMVIEHPWMELVAVRVFSEAKEGKDAGTLCGLGPTGIVACRDIETVLAAKPDCVVYLPDQVDVDTMCRFLASGVNVVTALIGFNHRATIAPDDCRRLEAACMNGRTSLYSTGSSPGWSTELVPLTLFNLQRRLDSLTITDFADNSQRNSPEMLRRIGFGERPSNVDHNLHSGTAASTPPTFRALADAIGLPLDEIRTSSEYAVASKDTEIAVGTIKAGTIGALRMGIVGFRQGKPLLERFSTWYVARDLEPQWEIRDSGWRMQVKGDTPLDVSIAFDVSPQNFAGYSPGLTAHPLINAVAVVCDASPGILETAELPMIVPWFGGQP